MAEDNATNALILRKMLESLRAEAIFVTDGRAACEAWEPGRFDLLIFDIAMPVLDGLSALEQIRDRCAAQGVAMPHALAATANVLRDQTQDYVRKGFSGVLSKPFNKAMLVAHLSDVPAAPALGAVDRWPAQRTRAPRA